MFDTPVFSPPFVGRLIFRLEEFRHGECCPMLTDCIEHREGFYVQKKSYHCSQWLSAITYMRLNGVNSVVPNIIYIYHPFAVRLPANN